MHIIQMTKKNFCHKIKKVTNDNIVDAKVINKAHLVSSMIGPTMTSNSNTLEKHEKTTNVVQNTTPHGPPRATQPRQKYTPLGEPIESVLRKLLQNNGIQLSNLRHYESGPFTPSYWNSNDFYEYHKTKGHKTST